MMPISISSISQSELITLVNSKRVDIDRILIYMTDNRRLDFAKQVQIALTHFAKGKPTLSASDGDVLDGGNPSHSIQWKAIQLLKYLERVCRGSYLRIMRPMIAQKYPYWTEDKVKQEAKRKFLKYWRKQTY